MKAADASVAIAAFASWHPRHLAARAALGVDARIVAHAAIETYSVLTRLPEPFRSSPQPVRDFLERRFPDELLTLGSAAYRAALERLAALEIVGGSVYDALIAATAREHHATLLSLDYRAALIYERLGAQFELID